MAAAPDALVALAALPMPPADEIPPLVEMKAIRDKARALLKETLPDAEFPDTDHHSELICPEKGVRHVVQVFEKVNSVAMIAGNFKRAMHESQHLEACVQVYTLFDVVKKGSQTVSLPRHIIDVWTW